ncbi:PepSY domain-containing protein [Aurantimonas litoralis]|nr:PepSY domain-containing protein [Aurantimonas litoralis]
MSRLKISIVAFAILTLSGTVAASQESPELPADLPPKGSVKLSQLISETEGRAGFHAIKSISYSRGEYEVVYYMMDGAEVRLNFDVKTGAVKPPKSGGLFGG